MRKRMAMAALGLSLMMAATPVKAETCHDLVMSYILADQDPPTERGDRLYGEHEQRYYPTLMETTAYYYGSYGSHGDLMREGYAAAAPDMYGDAVMLYEAVEQKDGTYKLGAYLDTLEIKDTGYGYPTNEGKSAVRSDKESAGTIESGVHVDVYKATMTDCEKWMEQTGGYVFAIIVPAKG